MSVNIRVVVVGGGGGGGSGATGGGSGGGGGGGGGQVIDNSSVNINTGSYSITVGGAAQPSSFDVLVIAAAGVNGVNASGTSAGPGGNSGSGKTGGIPSGANEGGGGGGGGSANATNPGNGNGTPGGAGTSSNITGSSVTYGGGGGGGGAQGGSGGSSGGGGSGAGGSGSVGGNATANTGGGGGGGGGHPATPQAGGTGASGVVILRFPTGTFASFSGGSSTTVGGDTLVTFNSSGTFTCTLNLPTVTTQAASSVTATSATANGNITNIGSGNAISRGVVYDTASHPLPGNVAPGSSGYASNVTESGSFGTGAFTESLTGLSVNTVYYYRAYAQNAEGYSYGTEVSFIYSLPTVTTQPITFPTNSRVTANGTVTSLNGSANCDIEGFVYDTASHPLPGNVAPGSSGYASAISQTGLFGVGSFFLNINFLSLNTTYYLRAYAHIASTGGYAYGSEISFTLQDNFLDILGTLVVSGYKWLTQKLLNAQQSFTVRPYFTAKIIDDKIKPTGVFYPNVNPNKFGSTASTPDNNIVAAGFGSDNKIHFWKGRNLANGTWDKDVIIDASSAIVSPYALNQVSIAVSDFYRGNYRIDIAYFTNFDGSQGGSFGSHLGLVVWSSDDGGNTWYQQVSSSGQIGYQMSDMPLSNYNSSSTLNLYLALMKPRLVNSVMTTGLIYLCPSGYTTPSSYTSYNLKYVLSPFPFTSANILAPVLWGGNVNSLDWTIHSFDTYYKDGIDYILFSGFHNIIDIPNNPSGAQNPNYALWLTAIQRRYFTNDNSTITDLWLPPVSVLPADSATPVNQNQYIFPRAMVENGAVQVIFKAVSVTAISLTAQGTLSTLASTQDTYMRLYAKNGKDFSYPQILVDANGNLIIEANSNNQLQGFIRQDNYYYICGGNQIYQFIQNNIVADVTADVIGYTTQESAGQPSSIKLQVANQNNQWVGSAPTNPGAAAISGNNKIAIQQGYYNSDGLPEVVPRNIYFIDDIQQSISGNSNNLSIVGRDLYKKLITLITRFSFQYIGPYFYTDVFDGTTISNYNQISGSWIETANQLTIGSLATGDNIIMLTALSQVSYGSVMAVNVGPPGNSGGPGTGGTFIYLCYFDSNNWLRLHLYQSGGWAFQVETFINGSKNIISSGLLGPNWTSGNLSFFIRQHDYYKWSILYTDTGSSYPGNPLEAWNFAAAISDIDMTSIFSSTPSWQNPWSVGFGANGNQTVFSFFRFTQFNPLSNITTVSKSLAAKAEIMDIVTDNQFADDLTMPLYIGQFNIFNRTIVIPPNGKAINTDINKQIGNGELSFYAKMSPVSISPTGQFGMYFYFRINNAGGGNTNPYNAYRLRVWQGQDGNGPCNCRFERLVAGSSINIFPNSLSDDQFGTEFPNYSDSLNLDLTQFHKYQIEMIDGWFYAYIDNIMVAAWNDNNDEGGVGLPYNTNGFWGFASLNSNSNIVIKNILSPNFWKPIQSFSFNPGDDANDSISTLVQMIRGWYFSDLFGRIKFKLLSQTETSDYIYDEQIWDQNVDDSDKEYVSQVIVYGTGVMATSQNTTISKGVMIRDAVIVDYTITTQTDAQARADQELLNYNQYLNQYEPTLIMNVGSELFDPITVVNTGNNTSGVNSTTRVYSQTLNEGGGTNNTDYSMQVQTGNL